MGAARRDQILAEVIEFSQPPRLEDDEFTIAQFAAQAGLSHNTAADRLEKQLNAGRLERRRVLEGGHNQWAYRLIEDEDESVTSGMAQP